MASKKKILVTGDVVIDHHIYKGERSTTSSTSASGTYIEKTYGGSKLLFGLLKQTKDKVIEVGRDPEVEVDLVPFDVSYGLDKVSFGKVKQHACAEWAAAKKPPDDKMLYWDLTEALGYGDEKARENDYSKMGAISGEGKPDLIVIDDGNLGFRKQESEMAWPSALRNPNRADPWVVLKLSRPFDQSALWERVKEKASDRLVLILSIEDLREESGMISKGVSWEQTARDLAFELRHNRVLAPLASVSRHLVVTIGLEGAFYVNDLEGTMECWYRLLFDDNKMEGEISEQGEHGLIGKQTTFTAGFACQFIQCLAKGRPIDNNVVEDCIQTGLGCIQKLYSYGHVSQNHGQPPSFPFKLLAGAITSKPAGFAKGFVPRPDKGAEDSAQAKWTILENNYDVLQKGAPQKKKAQNGKPLLEIARRVALYGKKELEKVPSISVGKFFSVDRQEIERLRNIRNLIFHYAHADKVEEPLSLAVFGPPGSGKSFAVKQIAEDSSSLGPVEILEFNLSQFSNTADLIGAFHQVRDKILSGKLPFVFWDEFDTQEYRWLQYLLAPMQDGKFQEGQITHPIGKCIFIFAGGTSHTMEEFGLSEPKRPKGKDSDLLTVRSFERELLKYEKFVFSKGPDFKSRLQGYLNVVGPNPKDDAPEQDVCYPVRRAIFMRSILGLGDDCVLDIDWGLMNALLSVDRYNHGARSLEKILLALKATNGTRIVPSNLPSVGTLNMYVGTRDFFKKMKMSNSAYSGQLAESLAPKVHGIWLDRHDKPEEFDRKFALLPVDAKVDNIVAARRISEVLDAVGLRIVPEHEAANYKAVTYKQFLRKKYRNGKTHLEVMAEREHRGWSGFRKTQGWTSQKRRNDYLKHHPCLVAYAKLRKPDKDKNRDAVRNYETILKWGGYCVVQKSRK